MSRKVLGRGLGALIPSRPQEISQGPTMIPIDRIAPNPQQPRKVFDPTALAELVESVKSQGILQPVLVKPVAGGYELIAGERRWRAATMAGLREIPALVKEAGREESLVMAMIENLQREDFNPIETATGYQGLIDEFGLTQEEVAGRMGKDRASVANYLRLLRLPQVVQEDLSEGRLSMGQARALLSIPEPERLLAARETILARGLSVREAEALVRKFQAGAARKGRPRAAAAADPNLRALEEESSRRLGTKVRILPKGQGGTLEITYYSAEDLERVLERILGHS